MRLIAFQTQTGQSVMVNPNQVRCIISVGTNSKIEFGHGHSILVTIGAEAIKNVLMDEEGDATRL